MTKLEQAARQALEALELAKGSHGVMIMSNPPHDAWAYRGCDSKLSEAITALREALAEPHKQSCACEVCRGCDNADIKAEQAEQEPLMITPGGGAFPFAVVGELEQAEQEPVAVVGFDTQGWRNLVDALTKLPGGAKLYAAPVRTKDLTDEEIMDLVRDECVDMRWPSTPLFIARAVITKFKEKNK